MKNQFFSASLADDVVKEISSIQPTSLYVVKPTVSDVETTAFSGRSEIMKDFIERDAITRNAFTGAYNSHGIEQTEQQLNGRLIYLLNKHSYEKTLTKQYFETFMNSSHVPEVNPIKEYLETQQFNGYGYIDALIDALELVLSFALEQKERGLTKKAIANFIRKWLIGMVASLYNDNYNCLLFVLIGPKGCGKTEFFRRLLPGDLKPYFAESRFDQGKDDEAKMCENIIVLNDELNGLNKRESREFRSFISKDHYYYRPPYGKQNVKRKRIASCAGTSNDTDIIDDIGNNRRIIPIEIASIDFEKYNSVDKEGLIAEAYQLYKDGVDWNLSKADIELLDLLCQPYEVISIEKELVIKYVEKGNTAMTCSEIKMNLEEQFNQTLSLKKISVALRELGFEERATTHENKRGRYYNVAFKAGHHYS